MSFRLSLTLLVIQPRLIELFVKELVKILLKVTGRMLHFHLLKPLLVAIRTIKQNLCLLMQPIWMCRFLI